MPIVKRRLKMLTKYPKVGDMRQIVEFFLPPRAMLKRMMQLLRQRMQSAVISLLMKVKFAFWNILMRSGMFMMRMKMIVKIANTFEEVNCSTAVCSSDWLKVERFPSSREKSILALARGYSDYYSDCYSFYNQNVLPFSVEARERPTIVGHS